MTAIVDVDLVRSIFFPDEMKRLTEDFTNVRFAYYTNAETAMKIIKNKEVWLRSATVMNDFSEISYGRALLGRAMNSAAGKKFMDTVESLFCDVKEKIFPLLGEGSRGLRHNIYLSCLSLHDPSEDQMGRLSMWRAYGDVAFVINSFPIRAITDQLGVYSIPVKYLDQSGVEKRFNEMSKDISNNADQLRGLGETCFINIIERMMMQTAIGTKHPGFREEREWRIFFHQTRSDHSVLIRKVVSIGGVPQVVWTLPLCHAPDNGLYKADIPNLLDRIIIGPTAYPRATATAFESLLEEAGVKDTTQKIVFSDIPLRGCG